MDGRLQALDKSLQPNHKTGSAAALTRDRAFEVQVLGQDLCQAFLVERGDPVLPAAVVGADECGCAGDCDSHVLLLHMAAGLHVSGPGSMPRAAAASRST